MGLVYPAYCSLKAAEARPASAEATREKNKWLVYWSVYGLLTAAERPLDKLLQWWVLCWRTKGRLGAREAGGGAAAQKGPCCGVTLHWLCALVRHPCTTCIRASKRAPLPCHQGALLPRAEAAAAGLAAKPFI